jgi:hypothetical protein
MSLCRRALLTALFISVVSTAFAQTGTPQPEMGTPQQRAACGPDVGRYCKSVKTEDGPFAYLSCLQANRIKLRPACLKVIEGAL